MILALASSAHAFFVSAFSSHLLSIGHSPSNDAQNCVGKDDPAVQDIPEPRDNSGYCVGNGADAGARRLPCSGVRDEPCRVLYFANDVTLFAGYLVHLRQDL
ncbi:uncharacterized protein MYCGRDRAFT_103254 [Zymoseptoria tritici IPO323]|uniref:Uncharacterized protein n=1 Tax=Zymoseptoria tritici (strain CBS 115943 / IPO323) TaxID=336722 RepID=F9X3N2_ZYMTI|nr:uncharacterized protein MYCGRDRAFT_103254 [Zymoseptoria tritici IPO323]EGP90513.1 hypothetical protein MYCGRDRAFT_103254 [Zymoseptoria tritici IPO323]